MTASPKNGKNVVQEYGEFTHVWMFKSQVGLLFSLMYENKKTTGFARWKVCEKLILDHPKLEEDEHSSWGLGHLEEQNITDFMRLIGQSIKCTKSLSM